MLLPAEIDLIPQERGCKQNSVWLGDSASDKIVLTLLTEIVALYMGFTTVDV